MNRLTIMSWHGNKYISLSQILHSICSHLACTMWKVHITETAPSATVSPFESLQPDERIDTKSLMRIASSEIQIIDGEIEGYSATGTLTLRLRAVDSTWWDVETDNEEILKMATEEFKDSVIACNNMSGEEMRGASD